MPPRPFVPCGGASGDADTASARAPVCDAVMSNTTQWTKPLASGSSTISASDAAPSGTPSQANAGETFSPSQLNFFGIAAPSSNAVLVIVNGIVDSADLLPTAEPAELGSVRVVAGAA